MICRAISDDLKTMRIFRCARRVGGFRSVAATIVCIIGWALWVYNSNIGIPFAGLIAPIIGPCGIRGRVPPAAAGGCGAAAGGRGTLTSFKLRDTNEAQRCSSPADRSQHRPLEQVVISIPNHNPAAERED